MGANLLCSMVLRALIGSMLSSWYVLLSFAPGVPVESLLSAMCRCSPAQTSIDSTTTTVDNSHGFPPPIEREAVSEEADASLSVFWQKHLRRPGGELFQTFPQGY